MRRNLVFYTFTTCLFFLVIFKTSAQNWIQRGQNFDGTKENERLGTSARMNGDGSIIAIGSVSAAYVSGAPNNVKIYEYQNGTWAQKGSTFTGERGDQLGVSLDLSEEGNRIVIGADQRATASKDTNGYILVYEWNGADWEQLGDTITDTTLEYFGDDVSISGNGAVITASTWRHAAKVYFWNGITWEQRGQDIPLLTNNTPQEGLSLNYDGSIVAAAGQVYSFDGDSWIPMGDPVGGYAMALSASGEQVISGSYWHHFAVMHEWDGTNWKLKGDSIKVNGIGERIYAVTISSDGNTIAYSSPASRPEQLITYDWDGNSWVKRTNLRFGGNHGALNYYTKSVDLSSDGKHAIAGRNLADDGGVQSSGRVSVHTWCNNPTITDVVIACGSAYTWPRNGATYTSSNIYPYTGSDENNCSQEYTLELTFADTALKDTSVHLCDETDFTWDASGITYSSEGFFKDTISGAECPTIYTLDLSMGTSDFLSESKLICDSYYYWSENKNVYTEPGTYQVTYTNQSGCDSVISLELELYPIPDVEETIYECTAAYTWPVNGQMYTVEGTYKDTISSVTTGCDSINTLHLYFQETELDTTLSTFFSFTSPYTSTEYTISGVYTENFELNGCAIEYTIDLEVRPSDPLNGIYIIDKSGAGDFISFSNAVEVMRELGVDGPVIFEAREGVYDETFTIDSIPGSSDVNTVTFQGENENVIFQPASVVDGSQFILVDEVANVCFKSLEFIHNEPVDANMILLQNASNICVENCVFTFNYAEENFFSYNCIRALVVQELSIKNSRFTGGITALYADDSEGIIVEENALQDIWIERTASVSILDNTFTKTGFAFGIFFNEVIDFAIHNNTINAGYETYGTIYVFNVDPATNPSVISNNFIFTPEEIVINGMDNLGFYHNTIVSSTDGIHFNPLNSTSGDPSLSNSKIQNNIIVAEATPFTSSALFDNVVQDHNLFYTTGATLVSYNGTDYADLADWQATFTGCDQNSQVFEPVFTSTTDLHIESETQYRFGDATVNVPFDIDGEARPATGVTDVGADYYNESLLGEAGAYADSVCVGSITTFTDTSVIVGSPVYYQWDFENDGSIDDNTAGNTSFSYATAGTYEAMLVISNDKNATDTAYFDVVVYALPTVGAGSDVKIDYGDEIELTPTYSANVDQVSWIPTSTLDDPTVNYPIASPTRKTTYTVEVSTTNGCTAKDSLTISINFFIPTGFTPDGDGVNDSWEIPALVDYPEASIRIYDRSGQRIFSGQGADYWDGTYNGNKSPAGAYFYELDLNNGQMYSGQVNLIRLTQN